MRTPPERAGRCDGYGGGERGVVMITFYPAYTNCEDPAAADLAKVADHIEYAASRMGWGHVGVGADFDGMA